MGKIPGSAFDLSYRRTTPYPIDATSVFSTLESATEYARNNGTEVYVPYEGQIISVSENGNIYKLVKDDSIPTTGGRKHYRLAALATGEESDGKYISKTKDDTAAGRITFEKGITTLNALIKELADTYDLNVSHTATLFRTVIKDFISSEKFTSGMTGSGMKLYKAVNGDWNLELDNVTIRKAMTVFEMVISKIHSVNGGLVISPANGKVTSVSETGSSYVLGTDGDSFADGDLVRCQSYSSKGMKYYWVPVSSEGSGIISCPKSAFNGAIPAVGDELVQMGNTSNRNRQGVIYLTAAEDGKPRISVLDGVNSTDLPGKSKVILGCLDGIADTDFPSNLQPSGYGLYAMNVFLKGTFILKNGKSVDDALEEDRKGDKGDPGDKGEQGIPGTNGSNGMTSYFHIKYAPVLAPASNQLSETPDDYIGTYVDYTEADSNDPARYTWALFKGIQGDNGEKGIPGVNGTDGRTSYLHIKYSDNGIFFTYNNGETPGNYIGQYTDFTEADSNVFSDYTWTKVKGDKGDQGIQGIPGAPGAPGAPGIQGAPGFLDEVSLNNLKNDFALKVGYPNYQDMANKAASGLTIIDGGHLRSSLIEADAVFAQKIAAVDITTGRLTVKEGAKIGGFEVKGNALSSINELGSIELGGGSGTRFLSINASSGMPYLKIRDDWGPGCIELANGSQYMRICTKEENAYYAFSGAGQCKILQRAGDVWCMPGVLVAGYWNWSSGVSVRWGNGAGGFSVAKTGTGEYKISHGLNHNEYIPIAFQVGYQRPDGNWLTASCTIVSITNTSCTIGFRDGSSNLRDVQGFVFALLGRNVIP